MAQPADLLPHMNEYVTPLLTDFYQITMAYAYWKLGKHDDHSVFDLYFRKNPFDGEFTIFAGLSAALTFLHNYAFQDKDISYLKEKLPGVDQGFFTWLKAADCSKVKVYALKEGSVCFPLVPMLRVEGPLAICQLLETTLLNTVNYASLVCTNAARFRLAAGPKKILLEFGLRRAQGPDGGMSASKYTYMGGFDGTSNVLAGQIFGIGIKGTHAHAFVSSFTSMEDLGQNKFMLDKNTQEQVDFVARVKEIERKLNWETHTNQGELAAFIGYALSFPTTFLALVDTYNTLKSGVPNFCIVAAALLQIGYTPVGVRLDSGDLAYLSRETRKMYKSVGEQLGLQAGFDKLQICASNELSEETILSLNQQGHEIDIFGVGTNLVTCHKQTALGGVYKLVSINGQPRMKLSQELSKVTIPGRKTAYRLLDKDDVPILDLMTTSDEPIPTPNQKILCRHPFVETKRAFVLPTKVEPLHRLVWDGKLMQQLPTLDEMKDTVKRDLARLREDHRRHLNPTPYKVSVTQHLYDTFHNLWLQEAPIEEIK